MRIRSYEQREINRDLNLEDGIDLLNATRPRFSTRVWNSVSQTRCVSVPLTLRVADRGVHVA